MVIQKNILYIVLTRMGYLVLIAILLSLLANMYTYFSHSQTAELDVEAAQLFSLEYHTPTINWDQPKVANGRLLEQFDNDKISRAYQNAWYFLNESLRKQTSIGLNDYFAEHLVEEIEGMIKTNKQKSYIEDRVDLEHNVDLHLFSIDKQVIAFKDRNVRIKRKVSKLNQIVYEQEVFKSYEVVMTLADGKWKVLQMKETENKNPGRIIRNAPRFVMDSTVTFVGQKAINKVEEVQVNCKTKPKEGFHRIAKGETLYRLSKKYNTSVKNLMTWNGIKNISEIKLCSHLRVKPFVKERKKIVLVTPKVKRAVDKKNRVVEENETIFSIAKEMNIDASLLKSINNLNSNDLKPDQVLQVPNLLDINKEKVKNIKGINYYPQDTPWWDFWVEFDSKIIRKDLIAIKQLKMNTVRVFVPSDGVIPGLQFNVMLDKLETLMDECHQLDLQVMITMFDFPVSFDLDYYNKSERQLEGLMNRLKNHPALLGWDLKNEPDLDFERHGKKKVLQWLEYLIERAREYDPKHLLTIGWSNPEDAVNLADQLDLVSYHYYRDPKSLKLDMLKLKRAVKNKPLLLQEFGLPSDWKWYKPFGHSEDEQAEYLREFKQEMEENRLPYLLWTLYDFKNIPTQVFGYKKWTYSKQKYFGLIDKKGNKKPAYYVFFPYKLKQ